MRRCRCEEELGFWKFEAVQCGGEGSRGGGSVGRETPREASSRGSCRPRLGTCSPEGRGCGGGVWQDREGPPGAASLQTPRTKPGSRGGAPHWAPTHCLEPLLDASCVSKVVPSCRNRNGWAEAPGADLVAGDGEKRFEDRGREGKVSGPGLAWRFTTPSCRGAAPSPPTALPRWRRVPETRIISINTSHRVITQAPTFPPA